MLCSWLPACLPAWAVEGKAEEEEEEEEEETRQPILAPVNPEASTQQTPVCVAAVTPSLPPEEPPTDTPRRQTSLLADCLATKKKCLVMYIASFTLLMTCISYFEPLARHGTNPKFLRFLNATFAKFLDGEEEEEEDAE